MIWERKPIKINVRALIYGPLGIAPAYHCEPPPNGKYYAITHIETGHCFPRFYTVRSDKDFEKLKIIVELLAELTDWSGSDASAFEEKLKPVYSGIRGIEKESGLDIVLGKQAMKL